MLRAAREILMYPGEQELFFRREAARATDMPGPPKWSPSVCSETSERMMQKSDLNDWNWCNANHARTDQHPDFRLGKDQAGQHVARPVPNIKFKEWEHVLIKKVEQLLRDRL
jgi:hypothetical protein